MAGASSGTAGSADIEVEPDGDVARGVEVPHVPQAPSAPSKELEQEHINSGHAVYMPWCTACVVGRARAAPHRTLQGELAHEIVFDYLEFGPISLKKSILVGKCTASNMLCSTEVPSKGLDGYTVLFVRGFIEMLGCRRLTRCIDGRCRRTPARPRNSTTSESRRRCAEQWHC